MKLMMNCCRSGATIGAIEVTCTVMANYGLALSEMGSHRKVI